MIPEGSLTDTAAAFIVQQRPERFDENSIPQTIQSGQLMDIWITQEMKNLSDSSSIKKEKKL